MPPNIQMKIEEKNVFCILNTISIDENFKKK
jgi:hypothetical protein